MEEIAEDDIVPPFGTEARRIASCRPKLRRRPRCSTDAPRASVMTLTSAASSPDHARAKCKVIKIENRNAARCERPFAGPTRNGYPVRAVRRAVETVPIGAGGHRSARP